MNEPIKGILKILKIEEMAKVLIYIYDTFLSKNGDKQHPLTLRAPEYSHDVGATQKIRWRN